MSHVELGPIAAYNSLTDRHLAGYFCSPRRRRHLVKAGLITKNGYIVSESTYRVKMARKDHQKYVKEFLAQSILQKALDMERLRQHNIRQKVEEVAKVELVKRVKSAKYRKDAQQRLPLLSPSVNLDASLSSSATDSDPTSVNKRSQDRELGDTKNTYDESSTANSKPTSAPVFRRKKKLLGLDSRHLANLDSVALHEYAREIISPREQQYHGISPYLMPQMSFGYVPAPPKASRSYPSSARSRRSYALFSEKDMRSSAVKGSLMLHRPEPAMMYQDRLQSMSTVTMKYLGKQLVLPRDQMDPCQDILVEQQHCGGNTLAVFKEHIAPGTVFKFISRRHRGYPFSLSIYIDHVLDCRLSTCCEFKHSKGTKLGGKAGHFILLSVSGSDPCFRCRVENEMQEKNAEKQRATDEALKKEEEIQNGVDSTLVADDKSQTSADDDKYEEDFEGSDKAGKTAKATDLRKGRRGSSSSASTSSSLSQTGSSTESDVKTTKPKVAKKKMPSSTDSDESCTLSDTDSSRSSATVTLGRPTTGISQGVSNIDIPSQPQIVEVNAEKSGSKPVGDQSWISLSAPTVALTSGNPISNQDDQTTNHSAVLEDSNKSQHQSGTLLDIDEEDIVYHEKEKKDVNQLSCPEVPSLTLTNDATLNNDAPETSGTSTETTKAKLRLKAPAVGRFNEFREETSEMSDYSTDSSQDPLTPKVSLVDVDVHSKSEEASRERTDEQLFVAENVLLSQSTIQPGENIDTEESLAMSKTRRVPINFSDDFKEETQNIHEIQTEELQTIAEEITSSSEVSSWTKSKDDTGDSSSYAAEQVKRYTESFPDVPGKECLFKMLPHIDQSDVLAVMNMSLTHDQFEEICQFIELSPFLTEITLTNGYLNSNNINRLKDALTLTPSEPKILNLSLNSLDTESMKSIGFILQQRPSIKYLLLGYNPLGDEGIKYLVESLWEIYDSTGSRLSMPSPHSTLSSRRTPRIDMVTKPPVYRNIVNGRVYNTSDNPASRLVDHVENVATNLRELTKFEVETGRFIVLRELDLSMTGISSAGLKYITELLSANISIESINLSGNKGISSDGWQALGSALKLNKHTTTVTLNNCHIGDDALPSFAECLYYTRCLRKLHLESCSLSDISGRSILELLKRNTSLTEISLSGNNISDRLSNEINNYLCMNINFQRPLTPR